GALPGTPIGKRQIGAGGHKLGADKAWPPCTATGRGQCSTSGTARAKRAWVSAPSSHPSAKGVTPSRGTGCTKSGSPPPAPPAGTQCTHF
ncbi:hypothetical protein CIB84_009938, partial [Bambusicola thoracicus]